MPAAGRSGQDPRPRPDLLPAAASDHSLKARHQPDLLHDTGDETGQESRSVAPRAVTSLVAMEIKIL